MKVRCGFVSNSSSTSHIIAWCGDVSALGDFLRENLEVLPAQYVSYEDVDDTNRYVTPEEIIHAILEEASSVMSSDEYARGLRKRLNRYERYIEEAREDEDELEESFLSCVLEDIRGVLEMISKHDWVVDISFGNNDGDFAHTAIGAVMDVGSSVFVESPDFAYVTKSNR